MAGFIKPESCLCWDELNQILNFCCRRAPLKKQNSSCKWLPDYSHTSLCGVALYPHGDRRGSDLVAAGNTHVVPRHRLQPRDFTLERRHCDVDEPGGHHFPFSPTNLFNLRQVREQVRAGRRAINDSIICAEVELTLMWHLISGEKPSWPGVQLRMNLLDCLSITKTLDTGLGSTTMTN